MVKIKNKVLKLVLSGLENMPNSQTQRDCVIFGDWMSEIMRKNVRHNFQLFPFDFDLNEIQSKQDILIQDKKVRDLYSDLLHADRARRQDPSRRAPPRGRRTRRRRRPGRSRRDRRGRGRRGSAVRKCARAHGSAPAVAAPRPDARARGRRATAAWAGRPPGRRRLA